MTTQDVHPGGFILSPPPSSIASSSVYATSLPHPRARPLKAGGSKESTFIRHIDSKILHLQRRFAKRTAFSTSTLVNGVKPAIADSWPGDVQGYTSMKEACKEIEELVDLVWVSGTPSLQVPYLMNLALLLTTILSGMPPSPKSLFALLGKFDRVFASLLQGRDVETGEGLPGFENRIGLSGTEKVRMRSLVERTRVAVVEAFKSGEFAFEEAEDNLGEDASDVDMDGELVLDGGDGDDGDEYEDDSWDMQLARVYDLTMVELGDSLEAPNIGVITEGRG